MIDVEKHVGHWMNGALEEIAVSRDLLEKNRNRHALFFAHLGLEKALKAHVCRVTEDVPPRIHSLGCLAQLSKLTFEKETLQFFGLMNQYNIEGRYPESFTPEPDSAYAEKLIHEAETKVTWLKNQL